MTTAARFNLVRVERMDDLAPCLDIRRRVFIDEQKVPAGEEFDVWDTRAIHLLVRDKRKPAATGRFIVVQDATGARTAKLGRMAVLADYRRQGAGGLIVKESIELAQRYRCPEIEIHAQTHAIPFYEKHGFAAEGDTFDEAGIAHRKMRLRVPAGAHPLTLRET